MQYYVRESGFYADLVDQVDMRIPKCWVNRFDHETGRAFLLLEYLGHAEKGRHFKGCEIKVMEKLVTDLASMHGKFWMDQRLREIPWLIDWTAESLKLGIDITRYSWNNSRLKSRTVTPKNSSLSLSQHGSSTQLNG